MAWEKQKELQKQDIPSYEDMINMANAIKDDDLRALFSILYVTGARINEVIGSSQRKDFVLGNVKLKGVPIKCLIITLLNEKNKRRTKKNLPIRLDREMPFIKIIWNYIKDMNPELPVFDFGYSWAYKRLWKAIGMNPHFIRHIRATHLVTKYDLSQVKLIRWLGWSDPRPSEHYMELRMSDMVDY